MYKIDENSKIKKKYLVVLLVLLLVILSLFILIKIVIEKNINNELEAIKIFEENAVIGVEIGNTVEDIDEIQKNLKDIKYVKSVERISKEDKIEDLKKNVDSDVVDELIQHGKIFKKSFYITFKIDSMENLKEIKNIEDDIRNIDGIDEVETSGCNEIIRVYEEKGIKGLREYSVVLKIMKEQGAEGLNAYLEENKKTKELLKDFIHF